MYKRNPDIICSGGAGNSDKLWVYIKLKSNFKYMPRKFNCLLENDDDTRGNRLFSYQFGAVRR